MVGALASSAPLISQKFLPEDFTQVGIEDKVLSLDSTSVEDWKDSGFRQFVYQACTTFGFWGSKGNDITEPDDDTCKHFDGAVRRNIDDFNRKYYFPFVTNAAGAPSNILFINGSADFILKAAISSQNNLNPFIQIIMIEGGRHTSDLKLPDVSDTASLTNARETFLRLAKSWLGLES